MDGLKCHIMYGDKVLWTLYGKIPVIGDLFEMEDADMIRTFRVTERKWQVCHGTLDRIAVTIILLSELVKAKL